ncbi:unnamed protein product [Vicia faba]|uniref:Uncharacterized protein n=1 Tax=Vicia faba TaxID=3906 RepID=A0AAV0YP66_VICFA|nr:unnamed protein product [Vicia faba]
MCSLESSLTSSESSERKEGEKFNRRNRRECENFDSNSLEFPVSCLMSASLTEPHDDSSFGNKLKKDDSSNENKLKKAKFSEMFDMNSQFQKDMNSSHSTSSKALLLDLNCSLNSCEP